MLQVLAGIQYNKRGARQPAEEKQKGSEKAADEENQNKRRAPGKGDENHNSSEQVDNSKIQEISSTTDQNKSSDEGNDEKTAIETNCKGNCCHLLWLYMTN